MSQLILTHKSYSAKVLLLGEYTVLWGSKAIAVPYAGYSARWVESGTISSDLLDYLLYLKGQNFDYINKDKLLELIHAVKSGLHLDSTIPKNAGLGSSGSVVAAVYDYVGVKHSVKSTLLRSRFQEMESYFHGSSSGLDPLVIYTDKQWLIENSQLSQTSTPIPDFNLYNSDITRDTREYVELVKAKKLTDPLFKQQLSEIAQVNNQLIESVLDQSLDKTLLVKLSDLQYDYLDFLIPDQVKTLWKSDRNKIWKICGAGGGGAFLVFDR